MRQRFISQHCCVRSAVQAFSNTVHANAVRTSCPDFSGNHPVHCQHRSALEYEITRHGRTAETSRAAFFHLSNYVLRYLRSVTAIPKNAFWLRDITTCKQHIKPCGGLHLSHVAINNSHDCMVQKGLCFSYTFCLLPVSHFTGHRSSLTFLRLHFCYYGNRDGWQKVDDASLAIWAICMPLLLPTHGQSWQASDLHKEVMQCVVRVVVLHFSLGEDFRLLFFFFFLVQENCLL